MSIKSSDQNIQELPLDEPRVYSLEDLDYYWMENGIPVFVATLPNICDIVESLGFNIYYLLSNKITTSAATSNNSSNNNNNKSTHQSPPVTTTSMQLFKVVNNMVGRTVSPSSDAFDNTVVCVEESAIYTMPLIPHILIDKLDQFFRLVDAQHGTESIVMLTYDLDKQGPEGWGILVPDQSNTSVHCNYDPHSIAEIKPDNVMIVGSVHSHPGMSAYASGTDHKDQADFDGIHITFGWQKTVNNNATQYYIEMQMAGTAYKLDPSIVFEDYYVEKTPDPDVVEWSTKVKKAFPPSMGGALPLPQAGTKPQDSTDPGTSSSVLISPSWFNNYQTVPEFNIPDTQYILVAEVENEPDKNIFCPSCDQYLDAGSVVAGYCDFCILPIAFKNQSLDLILENLIYMSKRFKRETNLPVYIWCKDPDNTDFVINIFQNLSAEIDSSSAVDYTDVKLSEIIDTAEYEYQSSASSEILLVQGVEISAQDINLFESITRDIDVYDKADYRCGGCEFYYETSCSRYLNQLVIYKKNKNTPLHNFHNSIDSKNCDEFVEYNWNSYS